MPLRHMIGILGLRGVSLGTIKWEWIGSPGFGANSAKGAALQCAVRSQGGHSHGFHFVLLISRLFFVCSFLFYSGKKKLVLSSFLRPCYRRLFCFRIPFFCLRAFSNAFSRTCTTLLSHFFASFFGFAWYCICQQP